MTDTTNEYERGYLNGFDDAMEKQAAQEPVAWVKPEDLISDGHSHAFTVWNPAPGTIDTVPLYTAPPQREWKYNPMTGEPLVDGWPLYSGLPKREWVGLTKEETFDLLVKHKDKPSSLSAAVENLLREKNNGQREGL